MKKFEGNGAECYQKYHENGHKGTIQRMDHGEFLVLIPTWLSAPCTYTLPELEWISCTAGEALDAWIEGKQFQARYFGQAIWMKPREDKGVEWDWTDKSMAYRKEA